MINGIKHTQRYTANFKDTLFGRWVWNLLKVNVAVF